MAVCDRSASTQAASITTCKEQIPDIIQTDAPINPGNSGGVLVEDLSAFLQQAEPGQEATLTLLRDGSQVEVSVTLVARSG